MTNEELKKIQDELEEIENKDDDELTIADLNRHEELVNQILYSQ